MNNLYTSSGCDNFSYSDTAFGVMYNSATVTTTTPTHPRERDKKPNGREFVVVRNMGTPALNLRK